LLFYHERIFQRVTVLSKCALLYGKYPLKPGKQVVKRPDLQERRLNWYNTTVDVKLEDVFPYPDYRG